MSIKQDNFIDREIGKRIISAAEEKEKAHKSSGKLSASKLGDPLLWQLLYVMGIPPAPVDEYTYRKFLRGNHVEDWLLNEVKPLERQKFAEYRGVVGYIDAVCDTASWDFPCGTIPLEVKSVSNLKFQKTVQEGAQRGHKLQACLYALSLNTPRFAVSYVATDDYRVHTWIFETADVKSEVDMAIETFDAALEQAKRGEFPKFHALEKWQESKKYNRYPNFMDLEPAEVAQKVAEILKQKQN